MGVGAKVADHREETRTQNSVILCLFLEPRGGGDIVTTEAWRPHRD